MTAFDVDVAELRDVIAVMAACQRALLELAGDVEDEHAALQTHWVGQAHDAHLSAYAAWREGCANMVTALAGLRALGDSAQHNYTAAVETNLGLWQQVQGVQSR